MGGTAEPAARRLRTPFTTVLALSCACAAASATQAAAA
ncbi:MAG: cellulose biosynthesis protein BcsS, partial [Xanthomonas perforans]|nr:cellulose biosynthesis protein BcsS [Xanthomonas perforans]